MFLTEVKEVIEAAARKRYGSKFLGVSFEEDDDGASAHADVNFGYGKDDVFLAGFDFQQLPGCCGVGLLHDFHDNLSLWSEIMPAVANEAAKIGYARLMATTVSDQASVVAGLKKAGFKVVDNFLNARTDTKVQIWTKDTYETAKDALEEENEELEDE